MDSDLLNYPAALLPPGVDGSTWLRYLKGSRAFDNLYAQGQRCTDNPAGAACRCKRPTSEICVIFTKIKEIATKVGGATEEMVKKMN